MALTRRSTPSLVLAASFVIAFGRSTRGQRGPDSTGTIVGVIVSRDDGAPLAFGNAGVPAQGIEQLANDRGEFVLRGVRPGAVEVLVRRIGYTPVRVTTSVRAGAVDSIHVALSRLAVQLGVVRVNARRTCTNPGPPSARADPAFAAVFDQLEQNADSYRLLAKAYPFTYAMERRDVVRYVGGDEAIQRFDTITVGTGMKWQYAPGSLVEASDDPHNREVIFNIPSLIHFAQAAFLANHCFVSGGRDEIVEGRDTVPVLRIDFLAASRIRTPDVDGSMYIDPVTFQIRRSVLRLTRIPQQTPQIATVEVTTDFQTVVPSIAIASLISSANRLHADTTRPVLPLVSYETQRLLDVRFVNGKPGSK